MAAGRHDAPTQLSDPGHGSTAGAWSDDPAKGRTFPCESCGAKLTFHIGQQTLACEYCGAVKQLEIPEGRIEERDLEATFRRLAELRVRGSLAGGAAAVPAGSADSEIKCESCGATTAFTGPLQTSECPYCGSPLQKQNAHQADASRLPVDGVLPFQVDHDTAARNLKAWVASRWFAPNDFLRRGVHGVFNGVYLPYWTYDAMTANRYSGMRGEYYYVTTGSGKNRRRERRTRWYPASGAFQRFFDDVLVCAAHGLPPKVIQSLEPWPLQKVIPFTREVLSGYVSQTYETGIASGFEQGKVRIAAAIDQDVRRRIGGDTQQVHSIQTQYSALTYKHLLLPLWLLAYRYKDKSYRVAVNAATGEVQGERPWSWVKITLAVIAGLIVAAAIFLLTRES